MKNPSFVAFVKTLIATVAGAILVTAIVIFSAYMPFYTLLPAVGISAREEGEVRIHFLSVGEGDASIIEYPDGKCLLIDTGNGSFENDVHIYRYLKGLAPTALSVVLTHTDADHCGGMRSLFDKMEVEKLYLPVLGSGSSFYQRILKTAAEKGIPTEILSRYDVISHPSGAYAVCISPYSFGETDDNDASTVLYFRYGENDVLFAADISSTRERRIIREYELDRTLFDAPGYPVWLEETDILKVAHHGASSSSCDDWIRLLSPQAAIVSCGAGYYSHPSVYAVDRLSDYALVYRTDEMGDVIARLSGDQWILTYHTEDTE